MSEGLGTEEIRRMVNQGQLVRIRQGVYADLPLTGDDKADHRLRAQAASLMLDANKVFSHQTAGLLHELPIWRPMLGRVAVTRDGRSGGRRTSDLHVRVAPLPLTDQTLIEGLRATSLGRTAADLARTLPFDWGVPVIDAALAAGLSTEQLAEQAQQAAHWPGVRRLRAALEFGDARAESPGESLSRVVLRRLGLPAPELQRRIYSSTTGVLLGRPDFCWPELRVIGEFDGRVKYTCGIDAGDLADVVLREKQREHNLRADKWSVMRWVWKELYEPESILAQWQVARSAAA